MPDCILRVWGPTRTVRTFLSRTTLKPCATFFKGEPITPASSRLSRRSGFNLLVSRADGDLPAQCRDALIYLRGNANEMAAIHSAFGAGHAQLDFGLWDISSENIPWPRFTLSHKLVAEAGRYGLELELSFYGPPGGE